MGNNNLVHVANAACHGIHFGLSSGIILISTHENVETRSVVVQRTDGVGQHMLYDLGLLPSWNQDRNTAEGRARSSSTETLRFFLRHIPLKMKLRSMKKSSTPLTNTVTAEG